MRMVICPGLTRTVFFGPMLGNGVVLRKAVPEAAGTGYTGRFPDRNWRICFVRFSATISRLEPICSTAEADMP